MQTTVRLSASFAWWLKPYLCVLAAFCVLTDNVPDQDKLKAKIKRAMRVIVK